MKKFLSSLLTGFALFFSIPTILILASWNAIPGDTLYSVKSSLEDVALALTANTRIATAFSVNFTDRRFNEAAILLDKKGSTVGYELLVAEARQARGMILSEQDKKNGTKLVRKIEEYQADIAARQTVAQNLSGYNPSALRVAPDPTPPSKTVTIITTIEVVIEEEDDKKVAENLEEVLEELEEIKIEIEEKLPDMVNMEMPGGPDNSPSEEASSSSKTKEEPEAGEEPETEERNNKNEDKEKDKEKPPEDNEENLYE